MAINDIAVAVKTVGQYSEAYPRYHLRRRNIRTGEGATVPIVWFSAEEYVVQQSEEPGMPSGPFITVSEEVLAQSPQDYRRISTPAPANRQPNPTRKSMTQSEALQAMIYIEGIIKIISAPIQNLEQITEPLTGPPGSMLAKYRGNEPAILFFPGVPTGQFQAFSDSCLEKIHAVKVFLNTPHYRDTDEEPHP